MSIIFAILAFGLIILIHEVGHFTAAKLSGVRVLEFSIGMGPKLFSLNRGDTDYSIRALPIGGFVQMHGESEEEGDEVDGNDKTALSNKSPLIRFIVFFAGAFMNLVLAIIIFTAITMNFGYKTNLVDDVVNGTPAYEAGIRKGDTLLSLDGKKLMTPDDLSMGLAMVKGASVTLEYDSNGEIKTTQIKPIEDKNGMFIIGVNNHKVTNPGIFESIKQGSKELVGMIGQTFTSFKMLITGEVNFKTDVGGPVTIIKMTSEAAKMGIWNLMNLTAFLSVQIGVFNLLPFPALDGGHIFAVLIEGITRKKIPSKILNTINTIGFILLMAFMAVVVLKDIIFPVNI
ncbi:RIP metalloprotease [uncultured Clostridium sp.]|uniref:M50 family metallopeptidase n=1 Tax=uncultured Clostridium sp. TaxID=59620 RepID=UPI00260EE0B6|nr:M50 family metallopeptidase [uncultured Clostridium sp.]